MAVSIIYSSLEDAADNFNKAADLCKKYGKEAKSVQSTLQGLPGEDSQGLVNSAYNRAKIKAESATDLEDRCKKISAKITNFKDYAKKQDKNASDSITTTITTAVGERSFFQKIGDWIHDSYVSFLDRLESLGPVGKLIAQGLRKASNFLEETARKAFNFFKYGNGKYILSVLDAVKDICLALGTLIAAVTAAVFTGPVWLIALSVTAIVAASIYLVCQLADSMKQIDSGVKAFDLGRDGNITAARYYGEIDGLQSYAEHHDFGNAEDNEKVENMTEVFSKVKTGSKIVADLTTAFVSFSALGITENASGEKIVDFKRAAEAKKYKMFHDAGFNSDDYQTGGFDGSKGLNPMEKFFKMKNTKSLDKLMGKDRSTASRVFSYTLDFAKWYSNGEKVIGGTNALINGSTSGYKTVETVMDIVGFVPVLDSFTGDGWKVIDSGKKTIFNVVLTPEETEENSYLEFLKTYNVGSAGGR